jgi:hypothetical protein
MFVYRSKGAFRPTAARKGSKQAATRPLTLNGEDVIRVTFTAAEFDAWKALPEAEQRGALDSAARKLDVTTGKVQVTADALAAFRADTLARAAAVPAEDRPVIGTGKDATPASDAHVARVIAAAAFASGLVVLPESVADDTESVVADLFPDE